MIDDELNVFIEWHFVWGLDITHENYFQDVNIPVSKCLDLNQSVTSKKETESALIKLFISFEHLMVIWHYMHFSSTLHQ